MVKGQGAEHSPAKCPAIDFVFFKEKPQKTPKPKASTCALCCCYCYNSHADYIFKFTREIRFIRMLKCQGALCGDQNPSPWVLMFTVPTLGQGSCSECLFSEASAWMNEREWGEETCALPLFRSFISVDLFSLRQGTIELFIVPLRLGYSSECSQKTATCFFVTERSGLLNSCQTCFYPITSFQGVKSAVWHLGGKI